VQLKRELQGVKEEYQGEIEERRVREGEKDKKIEGLEEKVKKLQALN